MDQDSKESSLAIDRLDGYAGEPHTCMTSLSGSTIANSSISSMVAQKPIQVVPPTPVVRHAASPATTISMDTGQQPQLQNAATAPPSSVSFAVANIGGNSAPLLQQNVNIMNINLPTAVTAVAGSANASISASLPQPTTSMTTSAGSATATATLIQLPDGRLLLQQAAPTNIAPTIAFVSVPANSGSSGVTLGQHSNISSASTPMQSFAITVPTTLSQNTPTLTAYGQSQGQTSQVQIQQPQQQSTVQVVGVSSSQTLQHQHQHIHQHQQQPQTAQIVVPSASNGSSNSLQRRPQIKPAASTQLSGQAMNSLRGGKPTNISINSVQASSSSTPVMVTTTTAHSAVTKTVTTKAVSSNNVSMQLPSNMAPDELRRKIDSQINRLRALSQPTAKDLLMLQKLQEFSEQIPASSSTATSRLEEEGDSQSSSFTEAGSPAARTSSPNSSQGATGSRTLAPRPKLPNLMREINALLAETRDLMEKAPPHEETLLVEFRILGQRFMLRLTRSQKAELESVLAKATPEQQQKILSLVHEKHVALSSNNSQTATFQNTVGCLRSATIITSPCQQQPLQQHQTHIQLQPQQQIQTMQVQHQTALQPPTLTVSRPRRVNATPSGSLALSTSRKIVTTTNQLPQQVVRQQAGPGAVAANQASANRSPARTTQQQMVLTPQMRRSLQIRRQLQTEQQKAACPATGEPFRLVKEAAIALMKYHVYQDTDNSDHAVKEADSIITDACRLLAQRQRHILAAVRRLERRCVSRNGAAPIAPEEGGPNAEEAFVITDMALDLERDTLEAERLQFQTRPRSFQPLEFDLRTGKATPVSLAPPSPEEEEEEEEEEGEEEEDEEGLAVKEEEEEEEGEVGEEGGETMADAGESDADKEDVWESILESGRGDRSRHEDGPTPKRACLGGVMAMEESETDRAVAAIMGDTSVTSSSWRTATRSGDNLIHSEDPDVDAAVRSIM